MPSRFIFLLPLMLSASPSSGQAAPLAGSNVCNDAAIRMNVITRLEQQSLDDSLYVEPGSVKIMGPIATNVVGESIICSAIESFVVSSKKIKIGLAPRIGMPKVGSMQTISVTFHLRLFKSGKAMADHFAYSIDN